MQISQVDKSVNFGTVGGRIERVDSVVSLVIVATEIAPRRCRRQYAKQGGTSISVRGISTSASPLGFERVISIIIDGIRINSGEAAARSFFDVRELEILKGLQALLLGKNNSAGVILLPSASPTETCEKHHTARAVHGCLSC